MTCHFNPAGAVLDALNDLLQGSVLGDPQGRACAGECLPDDDHPGEGRNPDDYLLMPSRRTFGSITATGKTISMWARRSTRIEDGDDV